MSKKYTPGLIPWIALLFLLFYMVKTMDRMVTHLTFLELEVLELRMDVDEGYDEEEEWFVPWEDMELEDKEDRLRIALTRSSL